MAGRAGRIGVLVGALLLALPIPGQAGSSQAALAVGVVVPARCAVRVPGSVGSAELRAAGAHETVAMRCTKGTLPADTGSAAAPGTVGPRITRSLGLSTASAAPAAPRSLTETSPLTVAESSNPHIVITVDF
ncbi:MAG: hypothetical protein ACREMO_04090 [Gemmatimonadales bacterium]